MAWSFFVHYFLTKGAFQNLATKVPRIDIKVPNNEIPIFYFEK